MNSTPGHYELVAECGRLADGWGEAVGRAEAAEAALREAEEALERTLSRLPKANHDKYADGFQQGLLHGLEALKHAKSR